MAVYLYGQRVLWLNCASDFRDRHLLGRKSLKSARARQRSLVGPAQKEVLMDRTGKTQKRYDKDVEWVYRPKREIYSQFRSLSDFCLGSQGLEELRGRNSRYLFCKST